jgi:hypothetical protein
VKEIGLWISRREAIVVIFDGDKEVIKNISANDAPNFYKEVLSIVRDADSIQIFGPDEAKGELEKCLEREGIENFVVDTTESISHRE